MHLLLKLHYILFSGKCTHPINWKMQQDANYNIICYIVHVCSYNVCSCSSNVCSCSSNVYSCSSNVCSCMYIVCGIITKICNVVLYYKITYTKLCNNLSL